MPVIRVPYETAEESGVFLELNIPEKNFLASFVPNEPSGISDLEKALLEAVETPIGGTKFSDLIQTGLKVTFVTENQFRAAPAYKLLPPLVKKAKELGAKVAVAIGNGKVPPLSPEEIREKLSPEVIDMGVSVVCNDASHPEQYAFLGNTSAGTPLWVLKAVAEADVVITISTTQATLWGYGGSGMILPAVSGNDTIETNHVMALAPDCVPGNNENRMQLDKYEALHRVGVAMGINVVVANNWDIIYLNAGDPVQSHREAVKFYEGVYKFDISGLPEKADIVITGSSAPTDHLLFHTGWAVVNCLPIAKEGASIILTSPCPGYHGWPGFALMDLMKDFMPPSQGNVEKAMLAFYKREKELWAGCIWYPIYKAMLTREIEFVTKAENLEMGTDIGLKVSTSLDESFKKAMEKHGPNAKVAFVPYGRYSVLAD